MMFNKNQNKMAKKQEVENNSINIIGGKTIIKGDVESEGDIRIDGKLIGNLQTKGKFVVGTSGQIEGEVICKNADISGKIDGKITISGLIILNSSANIQGDIITKELSIEPGAIFNGTCKMGSEMKVSQHATLN